MKRLNKCVELITTAMKTGLQKYAHELQGFIDKRYFFYAGHENPVKILSCSTYKTGKHGSAKTTLRMEDLVTEKVVSDIVPSDEVFYAMEDHPGYQSWADAQVSLIHYDAKKSEFHLDVTTYTENFEMITQKKVKLLDAGARNLEKLLDRLEIKLKPVMTMDQTAYELTAHVVKWSNNNKSSTICLNIFAEKA